VADKCWTSGCRAALSEHPGPKRVSNEANVSNTCFKTVEKKQYASGGHAKLEYFAATRLNHTKTVLYNPDLSEMVFVTKPN
jgi:hypothetical protein